MLTLTAWLRCCNSMLSYQWDSQTIVERLNISLLSRGYLTWFDLSNMKGATLTCKNAWLDHLLSRFTVS